MINSQYISEAHELSRRVPFQDPAVWVEFFYDLGRHVDNEFYRRLGRDVATRGYPSVLVRRFYDDKLKGRVEGDLQAVLDATDDTGVHELSKRGLEAAQSVVRQVDELASSHDGEQPERFYNESYRLVREFVSAAFRVAQELHVVQVTSS